MTATRAANGRFLNGAKPGPGRPRGQNDKWIQWLRKAITKDVFNRITAKMIEQAEAGDYQARRDIYNYVIGKPTQTITVEGGGLFSHQESRTLILQMLASNATDNPILVDATIDQEPIPDATAHPTIRADSPIPIQGQLTQECPDPVPDPPR